MANINDVAKQAGVSIKTVSRVINKESSVRPATRDKVMAAVEALNYRPSQAARDLAGNRAYSIACVYDNPNAYYLIDVQNGILSACRELGFSLLINPCSADDGEVFTQLERMINQTKVAGLILTPPFSERPQLLQALTELGVQITSLVAGRQPSSSNDQVVINDYRAACQLTQYLIDLGHKEVGFVGGSPEHQSSGERFSGYRDTMLANGLDAPARLFAQGDYSFDSGVHGGKQLLELAKRPTAILAANDEMAAGVLSSARVKGLSVPQQLSIAGFEDSPFSRQTWPALTTVQQPNRLIAEQAARNLLLRIRKQKDDTLQHYFEPQLLVRDSTASAH